METMSLRGRHPILVAGACLALLALPVAGCGDADGDKGGGGGSSTAKGAVTVNIASFKFLPDPIRVKKGGKVTWVNQDKAPHTAETGSDVKPAFGTERLELGDRKSVTFDRPGKFSYYCVYHRFMTGTVKVVE